jgi:hypothetical protein
VPKQLAKKLGTPPVRPIEPRRKHGQFEWKAMAARPSHPQQSANALTAVILIVRSQEAEAALDA